MKGKIMKGKWLGVFIVFMFIGGSAFGAILDEAKVYLPFEGADSGISGECWKNKGTAGYDESPSEVGIGGTHTPTVTAGGVKGQAMDCSMMDYLGTENTYQWGSSEVNEANEPIDTPLEKGLENAWSFTVSCWVKSDGQYDQGRVMVSSSFWINRRVDFIEGYFPNEPAGPGSGWIKSSLDPRRFPYIDHWRFMAISYDGTKSVDNLKFYTGSEYEGVQLDYVATADMGQLMPDPNEGTILAVANAQPESNRPVVGLIDEFRIWSSSTEDSQGVLSLEDIEKVRQFDTNTCVGGKMAGDVNGDCDVDLKDFSDMAKNWMQDNSN